MMGLTLGESRTNASRHPICSWCPRCGSPLDAERKGGCRHRALLYRLTTDAPEGRYRLVKEVIAEPHPTVVLVRVRLEVSDEALRGKLRLYALLAPRLGGRGQSNTGYLCETA